MRPHFTKPIIAIVLTLAVIVIGAFVFAAIHRKSPATPPIEGRIRLVPKKEVIGRSVEGRAIEANTFGNGETRLVFVGGVHGGDEWNSALLAYRFMDYLTKNPDVVGYNLTITVIPSANPDGVYKVVGKEGRFVLEDVSTDKEILASGRFNANKVDLNRNFNCKWKPKSMWQEEIVSAGGAPFSEPEARALRDFVTANKPATVIFWHSKSDAVYASECEDGILPETLNVLNTYSRASGYRSVKSFDSYEITGDAEGWLASIGIPAITVELSTHEDVEWERNLAGIKALFEYYGKK